MFRSIAMQTLQDYSEIFEDDFDLDLDGDFLKITHSMGQFLLNYHPTLNQLWFSSPLSGAHHFKYQGSWVCTRSGIDLDTVLKKDLYGQRSTR